MPRPDSRRRSRSRRPDAARAAGVGPSPLPIERARPDTREPVACPHFGRCGGCSLLDRPYGEELAAKARQFAELLAGRRWAARAEVLPVLGAAEPLFARTVLKVPFGRSRQGPTCGFFRRGSHEVVDLRACAIQHPLLTAMLVATRALATGLRVPIYDEQRHAGLLRHLVARVAPGSGRALAGLVVREGGAPAIRRLARALFSEFSGRGLVGVVENVQERRTNVVLGPVTRTLVGTPSLLEEQDGLRLRGSITSFSQANPAQASVLYAEVIRLLAGPGGRPDLRGWHVADLYAGAGPIALRLAQAGARVTAIERHAAAVRDGISAARENGLPGQVRFLAADAVAGLRELDAEGLDALVVDPPRAGLAPALLERLGRFRFGRMAYVSCHPASLVRDLEALSRRFETRVLRPVDLFPRTGHLEVVALLQRRN